MGMSTVGGYEHPAGDTELDPKLLDWAKSLRSSGLDVPRSWLRAYGPRNRLKLLSTFQGAKARLPVALPFSGVDVPPYFGGCSPGLFTHFSIFSTTFSWLGRTGGLGSLGLRGSWLSLSIGISLPANLLRQADCSMNNVLILFSFFTHLTHCTPLMEPAQAEPS